MQGPHGSEGERYDDEVEEGPAVTQGASICLVSISSIVPANKFILFHVTS